MESRTEHRTIWLGVLFSAALGIPIVIFQAPLLWWLMWSAVCGAAVWLLLLSWLTARPARCFGLAVAVSILILRHYLLPGHPVIVIEKSLAEYTSGMTVQGLVWADGMEAVELVVDKTSFDYTNLDIIVYLNEIIFDVGVAGNFGGCMALPYWPGVTVYSLSTRVGKVEQPQDRESQYYRVHCDKALANNPVHVTLEMSKRGLPSFSQHRLQSPEWVAAYTSYEFSGAKMPGFFTVACIVKSCTDAPKSYAYTK